MKRTKPGRWIRFIYPYLLPLVLMFLFSQQVCSQEVTLKGYVADSKEEPMIGVTISVKGNPAAGTISDISGNFSLKVSRKAVIIFSFVGYKTIELPASELRNGKVVMEEDAQTLDEVVVVGYGSQKRHTMTGAISQVKSEEMIKSPVANMGQILTGRAAGVTTYQYSGKPGEDNVIIRIRGVGTLNAADPLVIVDGVERDFSQIDPNEVENLSILKDAASTAVFGIRGANGVIVITTKKGAEGPAKVSFSANFAMQQPIRMPNSADGVTSARMYNEAKYNDDPTQLPTYTEDDIALYANGLDPLAHPNHNWKEYVMKKASFQQKYNLSVSGGTRNVKYYTSLAFLDQNGLMKDIGKRIDGMVYDHNNKFQRVNFRSNVDIDFTPTTRIGIQLGGIVSKKNAPTSDPFICVLLGSPIGGPFIYDGKIVTLPSVPWGESPVGRLMDGVNETTSSTINTNINLHQKLDFIIKGLLLRGLVSYDSFYAHTLSKKERRNSYRLVDGVDADGNTAKYLEQVAEDNGLVPVPTDSWKRYQKMHAELAMEYKNQFGTHSVGALVLGTLDKKWWMYDESNEFKQYKTIPVSYMGLVGRVTYDYDSRYLFEFNAGYNGSENFAEGQRFAWFPAASIGWNVAEEKFIQRIISPNVLSKLKLRASYGLTGNDNTGGRRFMYLTDEYKSGGGALFGSSTMSTLTGFQEGKLGNQQVTWETAYKQNYGIDLGLFNNRLSFTAEYFKEDRKNILAMNSIMPIHMAINGQDVYNIGRVKNHGFELDGRWNHQIGKVSYFVAGNYSFARNEIIENGSVRDPQNPQLWSTGHPISTNFGYVADGFYDSQEEIDAGPTLGNPTIGDTKYLDITGDGLINSDDRRAMGYPEIPEINYGFSLGGTYKGFSFSCLFQGAAHSSKLLEGLQFRKPFAENRGIPAYCVDERWTPETAETAIRPKLTLAYNSMSYENSSLWLRDGSYLKLRNVEISYTFHTKQLKQLFRNATLGSLRVYVNGQNLYTWDKLKIVDPEAKTSVYSYPQLRVFNAGLSFNF